MKMLPKGTKVKIITGLDDGCHFFEKGSVVVATEQKEMSGYQLFLGEINLLGEKVERLQGLDEEDYIVIEGDE